MKNSNYPAGTKIRTEDGYVLTVQPDGTVTDGDLLYDSIEQLAEYEISTVLDEQFPQK